MDGAAYVNILYGYYWTGCKVLKILLQEGYGVFVYTHETQNCIVDLEGLCIRKKVRVGDFIIRSLGLSQ